MTSKTAVLAAAVSSLLALTTTAFAADAGNSEKCYGVAKAGKNDCAGAAHACAGQSSKAPVPKSSSNYRRGPASVLLAARSPPASKSGEDP
jgi:uncharacterized membrane protein